MVDKDANTVSMTENIGDAAQEEGILRLFHGNPDPSFIPVFGGGRSYHDYGNAFYCTQDYESAAEWACLRKTTETAYVYEYELHIPTNISPSKAILDFDKLDPIYWLSVLLQHRVNDDDGYVEEMRDRSQAFTERYPTNCNNYDNIYGWRADDRHFAIIRDFLNTLISFETAKKMILLGNLGKQIVIKSERAYTWIKYTDKPINKTTLAGAEYRMWHDMYIEKDAKGRGDYDILVAEARKMAKEKKSRGTSILELLE